MQWRHGQVHQRAFSFRLALTGGLFHLLLSWFPSESRGPLVSDMEIIDGVRNAPFSWETLSSLEMRILWLKIDLWQSEQTTNIFCSSQSFGCFWNPCCGGDMTSAWWSNRDSKTAGLPAPAPNTHCVPKSFGMKKYVSAFERLRATVSSRRRHKSVKCNNYIIIPYFIMNLAKKKKKKNSER